jgi:TM2 domain-containing membrane protein YozV
MIELPESISRQIPEAVLRRLDLLDPLTQEAFLMEFQKKRKSGFVAFLLWCVFPAWHYFYVGKVWVNLLFWLTFGGLGIWWVIDLFRLSDLVREYNKTVAIGVLKDIQFLG